MKYFKTHKKLWKKNHGKVIYDAYPMAQESQVKLWSWLGETERDICLSFSTDGWPNLACFISSLTEVEKIEQEVWGKIKSDKFFYKDQHAICQWLEWAQLKGPEKCKTLNQILQPGDFDQVIFQLIINFVWIQAHKIHDEGKELKLTNCASLMYRFQSSIW